MVQTKITFPFSLGILLLTKSTSNNIQFHAQNTRNNNLEIIDTFEVYDVWVVGVVSVDTTAVGEISLDVCDGDFHDFGFVAHDPDCLHSYIEVEVSGGVEESMGVGGRHHQVGL